MIFRNLLIGLIAMPFAALAADPLANDAYLLDKSSVVSDAKKDCGPQVDQIVKAAPQALIASKGESNVRYRSLVVCTYSLGAITGQDITRKSLGRSANSKDVTPPVDDFDSVQPMRAAMQHCVDDVTKKAVTPKGISDSMLYCMFMRGAEAGRDHLLAKSPSK